jgi:hypothetical protein
VRLEAVKSHLLLKAMMYSNSDANIEGDGIKNQDTRCADEIGHGRFASHRFTGVLQLPCIRHATKRTREKIRDTRIVAAEFRSVCSDGCPSGRAT